MTARARPNNITAEKSVLGSIFIKPAAFEEVASSLEVDDFFLPVHREIFEAMVAGSRRGVPIDPVLVGETMRAAGVFRMLDAGLSHLVGLANETPTAENVTHYIRVVKEKAILRKLIAACLDVAETAYGNTADFETFLNDAEAKIAKAIRRAP